MKIKIYQGSNPPLEKADITIVIDVLRAFTVAHFAFIKGAKRILLAETVNQALDLKKINPSYLLAGEVDGLAIEGFDLDNSPCTIQRRDLTDKILVQKTTNGVRAALNHLQSNHVFVTGFSNARTTANYVQKLCNREEGKKATVHIVASHPSGDDDLACAEFIKNIVEGFPTSTDHITKRIKESHVARKFFDHSIESFKEEDVFTCMKEIDSNFVMKVRKASPSMVY